MIGLNNSPEQPKRVLEMYNAVSGLRSAVDYLENNISKLKGRLECISIDEPYNAVTYDETVEPPILPPIISDIHWISERLSALVNLTDQMLEV